MSRETPPLPDEFELSVIGPGRGECVIVHLGHNNWSVIDSCTSPGSTRSVAEEYLSAFGQDAVDGVRLVIATHWHDDHIRGLSSALSNFTNAKFCCSVALQPAQFIHLVRMAAQSVQRDSGLEEFQNIHATLIERASHPQKKILVAPLYASANKTLLEFGHGDDGGNIQIIALSPSDGTFQQSLQWIASLMPAAGEVQHPIPNVTPNTTSIVLWIRAGRRSVLLGGDLEHSSHAEEGWLAVLTTHSKRERSGVFKIPHHGSANADCAEVWTEMLEEKPIAIVTPYSPSGLPKDSDIRRILARTPHLYCTSVGRRQPPRRDRMVERFLKARNLERFAIDERLGHVRVRLPLLNEGPANIELFNGAFRAAV